MLATLIDIYDNSWSETAAIHAIREDLPKQYDNQVFEDGYSNRHHPTESFLETYGDIPVHFVIQLVMVNYKDLEPNQ